MPTGFHPGIYSEIHDERARQERLKAEGKFTTTCADPMTNGARIAVLGEEFGEVCRAALEKGIDGEESHDKHGKDLRKELVQVAAVCVAWIEGLDAEAALAALKRPHRRGGGGSSSSQRGILNELHPGADF